MCYWSIDVYLVAAHEKVEAVLEHQGFANAAHFNVVLVGGENRHGVHLVSGRVFHRHALVVEVKAWTAQE